VSERTRRERIALFLLAAGGLGFLPVAPGTAGTAGGLLVFWGLHALSAEAFAPLVALFFFVLTCALAPVAIRASGEKDPRSVVTDEVSGYLFAVSFTAETARGLGFWPRALASFLLFRAFDIAKPWPVRAFERLPGGLGIAADDAAAGLLANLATVLGAWLRTALAGGGL
jgi:phosphatidylglycerophosphatase A